MFLLKSKLCPLGAVCTCPGAIYMYKIMKKKLYKIRLQRDFLKLATNDRSDKMFLLTSKFRPKGLSAPAPGLYTCINHEKNCIKSDFKEIFLKLVPNDKSDKRFLLTSKFCPLGLSAPSLQLYLHLSNHEKMFIIQRLKIFFLNLQQMTIVMRPSRDIKNWP